MMAKVLKRWLVAFMRPAFEAWYEMVQNRALKLELCQRVGRRWMLNKLHVAFDVWVDMVEDQRRLKRQIPLPDCLHSATCGLATLLNAAWCLQMVF